MPSRKSRKVPDIPFEAKLPDVPIVKDVCPFDAKSDANFLWMALQGGDRELEIVEIWTDRSNRQRQEIKASFLETYGQDLLGLLKMQMGDHMHDVFNALFLLPEVHDAVSINEALQSDLPDGADQLEIICTRTNAELEPLREADIARAAGRNATLRPATTNQAPKASTKPKPKKLFQQQLLVTVGRGARTTEKGAADLERKQDGEAKIGMILKGQEDLSLVHPAVAEAAARNVTIRPATTNQTPKAPAKPKPKKLVQQQLLVTVRRSARTTEKEAADLKKKEDRDVMIEMILKGQEDPRIEVVEFPEKGRGLIAREPFQKDEFVVEYAGDLVDMPEARKREAEYAESSQIGCYMYYFKDRRGKRWCVDATAETGRYGRLLNHSLKDFNLKPEVIDISVRGRIKPYLILRAKQNIDAGEELVYDYGDRDRDSLANFPWLGN